MRDLIIAAVTMCLLFQTAVIAEGKGHCTPTPSDEIGPFYKPRAPVRDKIGTGYILSGIVRSAATCRPISGARIEFWQAGQQGDYNDAYRATIFSDQNGQYRLETDFPSPYAGRPPHIHILVDVKGYAGLITQHYPVAGTRRAKFDLVLLPEMLSDVSEVSCSIRYPVSRF